MLHAKADKISLVFKRPAGTSRGVLKTKNSWIIQIWDDSNPSVIGKGEASIIEGLSPDWSDEYENHLNSFLKNIDGIKNSFHTNLLQFPSISFAVESALLDLNNGGKQILFPSEFTDGKEGIRINGLIWMGDHAFMLQQIKDKLNSGFSCLKLKIGAIDFDEEIDLLKRIRAEFSSDDLELRVDANGAFAADQALSKLQHLSEYDIHSIEQPIKPKLWKEMSELCTSTPIPIALDEELIGVSSEMEISTMLETIKPQYIILKPSLIGGLAASDSWIKIAENLGIGWWITSALESNIGLNAIAQYTYTKKSPMPQGLGTGQLFENNVDSSLTILGEQLYLRS